MRLICPNCGAQYEVPDDVIPTTGRDVQCSSCGNTWFQIHPDQDSELAEELDQPMVSDDWQEAASDAGDKPEPEAEPAPEPEHVAEAPATPESEPAAPELAPDEDNETEDDEGAWDMTAPEMPAWDEDSPAEGRPPVPPVEEYEDDYEAWDEEPAPSTEARRALDPHVADLLREEAEREARQRAAEREPLETQTEFGLAPSDEDEATRRQREAQERMARLRGDKPVPATDPHTDQHGEAASAMAAGAAATRRDLLPDIDEINSTLRSTSERRPAAADDHDRPASATTESRPVQRRANGFRLGFLLMVLFMVLAVCLYIFAPSMAESVPALKPILSAYVEMMNGLRLWLDGKLQGLLAWLDGLSAESGGS